MNVVIHNYRTPAGDQQSLETEEFSDQEAYIVILRSGEDQIKDVFQTCVHIREDDSNKDSETYHVARAFYVGTEALLERYLRWVDMEVATKHEGALKIEVWRLNAWQANLTIKRRIGTQKRNKDYRVKFIKNEDELYADGPLMSGFSGKSAMAYSF